MAMNLLKRSEKGAPLDENDYDATLTKIEQEAQSRDEKGGVNGYASLDSNGRVPMSQLASGTPDGTKFIRDDGQLVVPAGGGGGAVGGALNVNYSGSIDLTGLSSVIIFLLSGSDATYTNSSFLGKSAGQVISIYNSHFGSTKDITTGIKAVGGFGISLAYRDMVTFMCDGSILTQIGPQLVDVKGVP